MQFHDVKPKKLFFFVKWPIDLVCRVFANRRLGFSPWLSFTKGSKNVT